MASSRSPSRSCAFAVAVLLAGALYFPCGLAGQSMPVSSGPPMSAQLPPDAQAQLNKFESDLRTARASHNTKAEAISLTQISAVYYHVSDFRRTLEFATQAAAVYHRVGDAVNEAMQLSNIGLVYASLGENQKALDYYNQALPVLRRTGNPGSLAGVVNNIGGVYNSLGRWQQALDYFAQAQALYRQAGDRKGEVKALNGLGNAYSELGDKRKALDDFNQTLPISRQAGDRGGEASALNHIGRVYNDTGERQKALEYYNQALPIYHQLGDRADEAGVLGNIGNAYNMLGEKQKALQSYEQILLIFRQVGDRGDEATTLNNIGHIYSDLGQKQKALENYNDALNVQRQTGDPAAEARTLNNLGELYHAPGEEQKAIEYYNRALTIRRGTGDRNGEAGTLADIGYLYSRLGDKQKALEYYHQALPLDRAADDLDDESIALAEIGRVYNELGDKQRALEYLRQALPLATLTNDPLSQAWVLRSMMLAQQPAQPALAIFFGKEALDRLQQVRGNILGLDKELQRSFLSSNVAYYRDLADLLIAQGRLSEAEQVLDLLKEQEYSDYVRGETTSKAGSLALTPAEQEAEDDYQKSTKQIVALGEQRARLNKIDSRTAEQEQQYAQIKIQLESANKGLDDYYQRLYVLLAKQGSANIQLSDVKGLAAKLKGQIAESPHTVALYTLAGKERTSLIVITPQITVARYSDISEEELNKKVAALQFALRDPARDPKLPAEELYKVLIEPVKADLEQAGAETLIWYLDGVLRYVPMSALFDGKQYLLEKYSSVTITQASTDHLSELPNVSHLSAAAMGISQKYEAGLPELPAVVGELDEVVKDEKVQGANGVLPGSILLNGQFTEKALESQLRQGHGVVHIASHFVLNPGDDTQSYLLLAGKDGGSNGYHLTVAGFGDDPDMDLSKTDLLTLSACDTGIGGSASNGREVDGLGTMAQLRGAKAVISSLWAVNDASTGKLMADFYRRWVSGEGKTTKVEALRQAQLDLLRGRVTVGSGRRGRGSEMMTRNTGASTEYAHPYYWAPFVLMGNWR
jgi:CHAT domain-containing protein/Tfp pilus assembly protein PilF